jgi:hypothetical protein
MKSYTIIRITLIPLIVGITFSACKKDSTNPGALYVPTEADVTANATLQELKDGRDLYIANCGDCHSFYLPENFNASQWSGIIASMAPRTSLNSTQVLLVKKYVNKGK